MTRLRRSFGKYSHLIAITMRSRYASIWDVIGGAFFLVVVLFVFVQLWHVTYRTHGSTIEGLSLAHVIWYLVATETIILSMIPIHRQIEREIREGDVAVRLNKPYSYLLFHWCVFMGESLIKAFVLATIGGLIAWFAVGAPPIQAWTLPFLFFTFVVTASLGFTYASIIGLIAFWTEDVSGFFFILDRVKWLFGGFFMPITFFPMTMQAISRWTPFPWMIYKPARLAIEFTLSAWLHTTFVQLICLVLVGGVAQAMYARGIRRLNVNGG